MIDVPQIAAAFRAAAVPPPAVVEPDDALAAALADLHGRGAAGWPGIALDLGRFAAELGRRLGADATLATLATLHHDVYLAIAAADGDPAAVTACDQVGGREIDFAAGRLRATPTQADDVRSDLRRLLFTADDDREAAVRSFTGRGDLRGYARVIVARALGRRIQRDRREVSLDDEVLDAFAPAIDPRIELLREQYRPEVDAAIRAGIAGLPDRHRAVLRFHLLDGWSIDQIGARYAVHRATAARWLTTAREDLGARIRAALATRLAIPESQVDSIVALVTSGIELSLDRLLA
ncbi:MAG: hypothetical protein K8W52_29880 [Deltaproteobacteria bacterium]|nr:hypothetical protein [Deltaproteobacteria bacterium]